MKLPLNGCSDRFERYCAEIRNVYKRRTYVRLIHIRGEIRKRERQNGLN